MYLRIHLSLPVNLTRAAFRAFLKKDRDGATCDVVSNSPLLSKSDLA
jgi:hypothetical protein